MEMREQTEYENKQDKSVLFPENCCSIIADGADKSSFGMPLFIEIKKWMV